MSGPAAASLKRRENFRNGGSAVPLNRSSTFAKPDYLAEFRKTAEMDSLATVIGEVRH